jgi:hypothetical protein
MKILALLLIFFLLGCDKKPVSKDWCDSRTVADLLTMQATAPGTNYCATIEGKLVFRKDATRCLAGAYYLEDSTASVFVCYPKTLASDTRPGVVVCPDDVKAFQADTSLQVQVKAEGLFYPAKEICAEASLCQCQNGIEVERILEVQ